MADDAVSVIDYSDGTLTGEKDGSVSPSGRDRARVRIEFFFRDVILHHMMDSTYGEALNVCILFCMSTGGPQQETR